MLHQSLLSLLLPNHFAIAAKVPLPLPIAIEFVLFAKGPALQQFQRHSLKAIDKPALEVEFIPTAILLLLVAAALDRAPSEPPIVIEAIFEAVAPDKVPFRLPLL